MKEYFLKVSEFTDIPGYRENKQTMVDENQVNHAFDSVNDIFDGIRETGDMIFYFISDLTTQVATYFSNSF